MNTISLPVYDLRLVRARKPLRLAESHATCASQAALALHSLIGLADREQLAALFLNARNAIVGAHVVAIGSSGSIGTVDVSCVFRAAMVGQARALILGHNHPSGDTTPSRDDIETTRALVEASRVVKLPIVDHLIVTQDPARWASLRDMGLMS
jgi:DNA repair protein RadC